MCEPRDNEKRVTPFATSFSTHVDAQPMAGQMEKAFGQQNIMSESREFYVGTLIVLCGMTQRADNEALGICF